MNSALIVSTNFRGAPGSPTSVIANAAPSGAAAAVTWIAPEGGPPISSYTVRLYTVSPDAQVGSDITVDMTIGPPPLIVTVSSLANGTSYYFTVTANNAAGSSQPGISNTVTPLFTAPNTPTLSPTSSTSTTATISITYTIPIGGATPSGYQYYYSTTNSLPGNPPWVNSLQSFTLENLSSSTTYYVWGRVSFNSAGSVPFSPVSPVLSFTPTYVPSPLLTPTITAASAGNGRCDVTFSLDPPASRFVTTEVRIEIWAFHAVSEFVSGITTKSFTSTNISDNSFTFEIINSSFNRIFTGVQIRFIGTLSGTTYLLTVSNNFLIYNTIVVGGGSVTNTNVTMAGSVNASTWYNITNGWTNIPINIINDIVWNGSYWLVGGQRVLANNQTIQKSGDGNSWTFSVNSMLNEATYGIAWNGSYWLAVGNNFGNTVTAAKSTDGLTWTSYGNPFPGGTGFKIAWNGLYWIAVGFTVDRTISIAKSTNESTWISPVNPILFNGNDIAWNGSYWIAVGQVIEGLVGIFKSTDGLAWTAANGTFEFPYVNGISWNGSYWVAVGNNFSGTPVIATSSDGLTWTEITTNAFPANNEIKSVIWDGSKWIAGGLSIVATSTNGTTWNPVNTQITNIFRIGSKTRQYFF
jgi:hypothetical protein